MLPDPARATWRDRLRRAWPALLVISLAFLVRARDLDAPFDREFDGAQGAFFALGAVNYERLGPAASGGYPVLNVELGAPGSPTDLRAAPAAWYLYANHPPCVPLLAWAAVRAGRGAGWADPCDQGRAPRGVEPWIRAPFLTLHVAALLALWWAVRAAAGERRALLALAIASALPVTVLYGGLCNYENPSLLCALVLAGFTARWLRSPRARELAGCALAAFLGGAVSYAVACFVPPLALLVAARAGVRRALVFLLATGAATLAPIVAHGAWSTHVQAGAGLPTAAPWDRARLLLAPLFDGSRPITEWLALQGARLGPWFSWPATLLAGAALVLWVLPRSPARGVPAAGDDRDARPIDLEPALFAGGVLYLVAFYRHTLDPQHPFLLMSAPGLAGLAALALERTADRVAAPVVRRAALAAATLAVMTVGLAGAEKLRREYRGPAGDGGPALELPDVNGAEIAGLVPAGGFGIHPASLGLNAAVAFYAWRSLWPANDPADTLPRAVARAFGLGAAPHVLLLPKHPWPDVEASVRAFEREWTGDAPPARESAHWRAWDLP